jgi:hypothetical protein
MDIATLLLTPLLIFFSMPRQILQLFIPISILAVHFDSDLEMGQISGSVNF